MRRPRLEGVMQRVIQQALEIWNAGGWAMVALAANALIMFAIGLNMWLNLKTRRFRSISESKWRRWIKTPKERKGDLGDLMNFVMRATDLKDMIVRFNEIHTAEIAPLAKDLRFMKRAVSTAPLLGLLGTVTGMLTTFKALATGTGGDQTMELVAGGISEALITTETGLIIALPGLIFQYHLSRERDRYQAFLAKVETACAQHFHRAGLGRSM